MRHDRIDYLCLRTPRTPSMETAQQVNSDPPGTPPAPAQSPPVCGKALASRSGGADVAQPRQTSRIPPDSAQGA
jgi:hypothetical protein